MRKFIPVIFVLALFSCQTDLNSKKDFGLKNDTLPNALFKVKAPNGATLTFKDTVIYQTVKKYVFTDTATSSGGHWVKDTVGAFGRVPGDTARDIFHKPLYDSLKRIRIQYTYYSCIRDSIYPIPKGY